MLNCYDSASREAARGPIWVQRRNTPFEQMFSALPPRADIVRLSRHVRKVPGADIGLRDSFDKRVPQYKLRVQKIFG